jgi:heme A synthase
MLLIVLVAMQIMLGAFVIWSALQPVVNTIHVVNGALVLGTSLVLTLRAFRNRLQALDSPVALDGTAADPKLALWARGASAKGTRA